MVILERSALHPSADFRKVELDLLQGVSSCAPALRVRLKSGLCQADTLVRGLALARMQISRLLDTRHGSVNDSNELGRLFLCAAFAQALSDVVD